MENLSDANISHTANAQWEQDLALYQHYLQLWASENPIKTNKLQILLLTNALLMAAMAFASVADANIWIASAGVLVSGIWILSIGRTALFQKAWQHQLRAIAQRYPRDPRFQILNTQEAESSAPAWLRIVGGVSSKYYLMGAPIGFFIIWLCALFAALF